MRHIMMFVLVTFATLFGSTGLAAAAPPKSYCDELKGTTTGEVCKIQMTEPGYTVDISLPSNYPDGKSLESFVRETGEHFLDKAKSSTARDAPYELDITSTNYESAIPPRGTQSVVLKIYQNVGGPRPQTTYKAFNWDQAYRKPITWDKLWQPETDPLKVVFPVVESELSKQSEEQVVIASSAGLDPKNYQNFAISNDGITFFFSPGELLPEAAGARQVLVPRAAVDPMLA